jgi:hypothetical protein
MKLPQIELSLQQQLDEFDVWITPSIQEIQETEKYNTELANVDNLISSLGEATQNFQSPNSCTPEAIANTCIELIESSILDGGTLDNKRDKTLTILEALCSLLFMVTGKSDNNLKCQFPVYLTQVANRTSFPHKRGSGNSISFEEKTLGRTLKSDTISKLIANALIYSNHSAGLHYLEQEARWLLAKYISSILIDEASTRQFWALGRSYFNLSETQPGSEKSLLAPIIIFKVRGSVAASGGHIPEDLLRSMMDSWGMLRGVDYNLDDVIVVHDSPVASTKTRAYDFVLPYQTPGWQPHLFVQCQFYAGDSGSVSHKVVDQTSASRPLTASMYPEARFIEYLDGAGYYSSLNTDLAHMLGMETTKTFIQVRSAHVKLRRELQCIGFLTPLEIEHAIFRSPEGSREGVRRLLELDGYRTEEINRAIEDATNRGLITQSDSSMMISRDRIGNTKKFLIIDLVALLGEPLSNTGEMTGKVLIPGYGATYGVQLDILSREIDVYAPNSNFSRNDFSEILTWLTTKKFIIMR